MDIEFYQRRLNQAIKNNSIYEKKSSNLSTYRLLSFIILLCSFISYFFIGNVIIFFIALFSLITFISLIIIHEIVSKKIEYYKRMIETLNEYIYRFDNQWMEFSDNGEEFKNEELYFLEDLDIIGDASLYKYINICKTSNGKRKLIERLSNNFISEEQLIIKQNTMKEISENIDFSLDFQIALKEFLAESKNINFNYIVKSLSSSFVIKRIYLLFAWLLSASTLVILLLSTIGIVSWNYFFIIFIFQIMYSTIVQRIYRDVFVKIQNSSLTIILLKNVYKVIDKFKFNDPQLQIYQDNIRKYGLEGIKDINKIKGIESYNKFFVTYFLFNGLFSLNIYLIYQFKKFIDDYGVNFIKSTEALEELEVIASLAIIGQTKKNIVLPKYSSETKINFTNLHHPLIPENECVANSFNQKNNVNIITGSNMSGKTSFLRTIGINLILMNAGAFVNASSFKSAYLKIFISMRIADDLSKGISTFYAELLRIKKAIDYSKFEKPMIVFVDEIFKGTNSNDRIQGAISMIEKLNRDNIIIFISTHDFELCDINTVMVDNYHFTEHYIDDKIRFDYILKIGKCKTTNAKYLMKLAGILE